MHQTTRRHAVHTTAGVLLALAWLGCGGGGTAANEDAGPGGSDAAAADGTGQADAAPAPAIEGITADLACAAVGTAVTFTATVTGDVESYAWDFGDGTTDTAEAPAHSFDGAGVFTVSLTVTGPGGTDTAAADTPVRVIRSGWTRLHPATGLGGVVDLWQDPVDPGTVLALGYSRLGHWTGTAWEEIDIPGAQSLNRIAGHHVEGSTRALIIGRNADYEPEVYSYEAGLVTNADQGNALPHVAAATYVDVHMDGPQTGFLVLTAPPTYQAQVWRYRANQAPAWELIPASVMAPTNIDHLDVVATGDDLQLFLAGGSNFSYSTSYDGGAGPIGWKTLTTPYSFTSMDVASPTIAWLGAENGALVQAAWNSGIGSFDFLPVDGAGLWTSAMEFQGVALSHDLTAVYAVGSAYTLTGSEMVVVKVSEPLGGSPSAALLPLDGLLKTLATTAFTAYDDSQVWLGATSGYVARFVDTQWENTTGDVATGYLGGGHVAPDGRFLVAARGDIPTQIVSYLDDAVSAEVLPGHFQPQSVWPASATETWVFGYGPTAAHRADDGTWTTVDLGAGMDNALVFDFWGASPDDIWAIGADSEIPLVLHYTGGTWTRDRTAEQLLGTGVFGITGTSATDVYLAGYGGLLVRYDGDSWAPVTSTLFSVPPDFGVCVEADPSATCVGTGEGFATPLSGVPTGELYAAISSGTFSVAADAAAGCPAGQFRCLLTFDDSPFLGDRLGYWDGSEWTPVALPTYGPLDRSMTMALAATAADRLYAVVLAVNQAGTTSFLQELATWNGEGWASFDEQVPLERPTLLDLQAGRGGGDLYLTGSIQSVRDVLRYQQCID